jgi:hypothetical protein
VRRATDELLASRDLGRRIRRAPVPWLLGAALAGLVVGRWFARPLAAAGRRRVSAALGTRAREVVLSGLLAAFGLRWRPGSDGATPRGAAASDVHRTRSSDDRRAADPALSPRRGTS